jgi:Icc protein
MMRFIFFFYFIAIYFTSGLSGQNATFRFVFMTDIHLSQDSTATKGFTKAIDDINKLNPDFVIAGGDLIMNNPQTSYEQVSAQYQLYSQAIRQLSMSVYPAIGNHDIIGIYQPPDFPRNHADYGKKMFLRLFNLDAPYYSFDHKGWHFIVLDDLRIIGDHYQASLDSSQMVWLQKDLTNISSNTPIAVALHIPMVSAYQQIKQSTIRPLSPTQVLINTPDVLNLFEDKNLRLVLQGHLHIVEEIIFKNIRFVTGGAVSGAWWRGAKDGFHPGFVGVTINNDSLTWEYCTFLSEP